MLKKIHSPKSIKTYSKINYNEPPNTLQPHRELSSSQWRAEIIRLERLINVQFHARQSSQKQILAMIKHLDETKKSKINIKNEGSKLERFFSPNRSSKNWGRDQSILEYKNLLTNLKSQTQIQVNQSKGKINEIQQQIMKINKKISSLEGLQSKVGRLSKQFVEHKWQIENELKIFSNKTSEQLMKMQEHINSNCSRAQNNQNMLKMQIINMMNKVKDVKLELIDYIPSMIQQHVSKLMSENVQQKLSKKLYQNIIQQTNQLKQHLSTGIQKNSELQKQWMEKFTKQLENKLYLVDNCVQICQQTLKSVEEHASNSFDNLQYKIQMASENIIQTKETLEETFYGSEYRSRQKIDSVISLDCTQQSQQPAKRMSQSAQKMSYMESRIKGLERRMDSICSQYLSRPFHKQNSEEYIK